MASRSAFINQAVAAFSRLSGRERLLVGVTVVAVLLFAFVGSTLLVDAHLTKAQRRLSERRTQLTQILGLEGQYRDAQRERETTKQQLARNNVQLFSLLPKVAGEFGLTLNDLNERRTPLKDSGIDEISVDVNLKQMSLDKLDGFLERVEQGGPAGMVKVLKIKVKTRFDNAELLDVNMKVATYKPATAS
ncbi:MAG: type II secretion system protein GspM [Pseudomonadota bacterium]